MFYINMTAVLGRLIYSLSKCVMMIIGQEVENISNTVTQQTVGKAFQIFHFLFFNNFCLLYRSVG